MGLLTRCPCTRKGVINTRQLSYLPVPCEGQAAATGTSPGACLEQRGASLRAGGTGEELEAFQRFWSKLIWSEVFLPREVRARWSVRSLPTQAVLGRPIFS